MTGIFRKIIVTGRSISNREASSRILVVISDADYVSVRNMMGCMIDVARGKLTHDQAVDVLNRGAHFMHKKPFDCAAPFGLYLYDVDYDDESLDFNLGQWRAEVAKVMDATIAFPDKRKIEIISEQPRDPRVGV